MEGWDGNLVTWSKNPGNLLQDECPIGNLENYQQTGSFVRHHLAHARWEPFSSAQDQTRRLRTGGFSLSE